MTVIFAQPRSLSGVLLMVRQDLRHAILKLTVEDCAGDEEPASAALPLALKSSLLAGL